MSELLVLPPGWELLRFPATIEVRDQDGRMVHAHPTMGYSGISEQDLKQEVLRPALDPKLRSAIIEHVHVR